MSLTRPLTRSLTRALSHSELTQKLGGGFSIFALNPFLLFDARDSMIGTLENPTLDLNPALPETLDVITATRAGVATFTDANGLIASAPANTVRVDQTQGAELTPTKFQHFGQTEFDQWSHARTSETVNAITSPDGETNGAYFEQDTGNTNAGSIYKTFNAITGVYTASIYAKKKEKNFISFYDTNTVRTYFNLDTGAVGTVGSGHTAAIEDAGDGWFRCLVTFTASSGTLFAFYLADTDNSLVVTGGGGIYIYGPQLEEGTTASDFVANTTGSPKFITGPTFGPRVPMILVEPSATNLVPYSEDFSNAAWTKNNASVTGGFTSPDGTNNAFLMTDDATDSKHGVYEVDICPQDSSIYTRSVFVKKGTARYIVLSCRHLPTSSGTSWIYDTDANDWVLTGSGGVDQSIVIYGDGWVRLSISHISNSNFNNDFSIGIANGATVSDASYSGIGDSVYIWGAQIETGSVATSYIPTAGGNAAARTRAADDLEISGSSFSDFYNASEGTTYMEVVPEQSASKSVLFEYMDESAGANDIMGSYLTSGVSYFYGITSGSFVANASLGTPNLSELNRIAVNYKVNDMFGSINGATSFRYTSLALPTGIDKLAIGNDNSGNFSITGRIRRLIYWPYHSDSL